MANEISLPRGNTLNVIIQPFIDSDEEYILQEGDTVTFTVKDHSRKNARTYLTKTMTNANYNVANQLIMTLTPEDTINLEEYEYIYDCALTIDGTPKQFYTFITKSPFIITTALSQIEIVEEEEEQSEPIESEETVGE